MKILYENTLICISYRIEVLNSLHEFNVWPGKCFTPDVFSMPFSLDVTIVLVVKVHCHIQKKELCILSFTSAQMLLVNNIVVITSQLFRAKIES